jgi:hypothetical protein
MQPDRGDDLWAHKPWWCRPWSILLTGALLVTGSWLLGHRIWLSALVATAVGGWWLLFLVLAPMAYRQGGADRELQQTTAGVASGATTDSPSSPKP